MAVNLDSLIKEVAPLLNLLDAGAGDALLSLDSILSTGITFDNASQLISQIDTIATKFDPAIKPVLDAVVNFINSGIALVQVLQPAKTTTTK